MRKNKSQKFKTNKKKHHHKGKLLGHLTPKQCWKAPGYLPPGRVTTSATRHPETTELLLSSTPLHRSGPPSLKQLPSVSQLLEAKECVYTHVQIYVRYRRNLLFAAVIIGNLVTPCYFAGFVNLAFWMVLVPVFVSPPCFA